MEKQPKIKATKPKAVKKVNASIPDLKVIDEKKEVNEIVIENQKVKEEITESERTSKFDEILGQKIKAIENNSEIEGSINDNALSVLKEETRKEIEKSEEEKAYFESLEEQAKSMEIEVKEPKVSKAFNMKFIGLSETTKSVEIYIPETKEKIFVPKSMIISYENNRVVMERKKFNWVYAKSHEFVECRIIDEYAKSYCIEHLGKFYFVAKKLIISASPISIKISQSALNWVINNQNSTN